MRTDYEKLAARYDAARATPLEGLEGWRQALAADLGSGPVVDVGAGTGLWAEAFVQWFGIRVVAVEPSDAMRQQAVKQRPHPRIMYVGGRAERLPVRERTCGAAWLSTVVHHIQDLPACASELRRVLLPGGPILVRNAFSDRADEVPWLHWFPNAREAALRRWPTVGAVADAFATAGFALRQVRRIRHVTAPDLAAYTRTVRFRADSTLAAIPEADFARGVAAMERAAASGADVGPIVTGLDLLVLR